MVTHLLGAFTPPSKQSRHTPPTAPSRGRRVQSDYFTEVTQTNPCKQIEFFAETPLSTPAPSPHVRRVSWGNTSHI
jgi:hypothetical protein